MNTHRPTLALTGLFGFASYGVYAATGTGAGFWLMVAIGVAVVGITAFAVEYGRRP